MTYGFQMSIADGHTAGQGQGGQGGSITEPITLAQVKTDANIDFTEHDTKITQLITACREAYEKANSVSLIDHTLVVSWLTMFDDSPLPYRNVGAVTATDLDDVAISDVTIRKVGGESYLVGDYPNGIKLTYETTKVTDEVINEKLIQMVTLCLMDGYTVFKALKYVSS